MQFTTVKRAVRAVHVDGPDEDRHPEVEQVQGTVTFYPMLGEGDSVQVETVDGPVTVVLTPIRVRIADGMVMHRGGVGVQLFAGGEGAEPSVIRWRAVFTNLQSDGVPLKLRDVVFDAVPGGEVDLTAASPLANHPEPILRGPAGPRGYSVQDVTIEGGDLVVWVESPKGRAELSRLRVSEMTDAVADHKHTLSDISNAPNSHTSSNTKSTLMSRDAAGRARVSDPSSVLDIANKRYVDTAVSNVIVQVSSPPGSQASGVLYVIPE